VLFIYFTSPSSKHQASIFVCDEITTLQRNLFWTGGMKKGKLCGLAGIVCESLREKEVWVSKIFSRNCTTSIFNM